jgi:hypothetical protein
MADIKERIANLSPEKRALLEKRLAESSPAKARTAAIERNPNEVPVPSFGQETLWAMEQIHSGTAQYNVGFSLRLKGNLDISALKIALRDLVNRHETLRTQYKMSADGRLQLEFPTIDEIPITLSDFSGIEEMNRQRSLSAALRAEANRAIILDRDLLIRSVLYCLNKNEHVLQLTMHHVALDGWSIGVLFRDFSLFYNAAVTGAATQLPDLPIAFSDYARWQRQQLDGPEGNRLISYWKNQLRGSSFVLQLPIDRPRPPQQAFRGSVREYSMSASLNSAIHEFCLMEKATPFMVTLAALFAVLARYSGQEDILIGSPIAGRSRIETDELVGYFMNAVILRGKLDSDPSFRELLQRVRQTALEAYAHQDLPLELLIDKIDSGDADLPELADTQAGVAWA